MMRDLLWPCFYVFVGGGFGSVFRFVVSSLMQRSIAAHYPFGTLTVNIIGSFIIGLIISYIENRSLQFPYWRQLLIIGFLGGFTTFSAFSWDTLALFKNHEVGAALLNIGASVAFCLGAVWVGSMVAKNF
jgi:CrcB protein